MADKRGGYRRPSEQQSFSGVGKNSRRTDKAIKTPNVQDSTDLQVGDREKIRQGQQARGLPQTPSPSVSAPPRGGTATPAAGGGAGGGIPDWLAEMPTKRPDEPLTSGMDLGPGSGADILNVPPETEDIRIVALERYARELNNPTAQRYLDKIYRPAPTPETVAQPQMEPTGTAEEVPMEDDFADEEMGEEVTEAPTLV